MESPKKEVEIPKSRVIFAYAMCALGASLGPLDDYQEFGSVESSTLVISLTAFCIGIAVVHFVVYRFRKFGRFLHYDLHSRK